MITHRENIIKSQPNRNMNLIRKGRGRAAQTQVAAYCVDDENMKPILFKSQYQCAQYFGVNSAVVYMIRTNNGQKFITDGENKRWKTREATEEEIKTGTFQIMPHGRKGRTFPKNKAD